MPGEEVALIDGDVFVRPVAPGERREAGQSWFLPGWQIQRKPERAQRACWQPVFSSEYEPLVAPARYQPPWEADGAWKIAGQRDYEYTGSGPTALRWSTERWPVVDFYAYNETWTDAPGYGTPQSSPRQRNIFAVSDIRLACGVEPRAGPVNASAVLRARGHEFRADISGRDVTLRMGALGPPPSAGPSGAPSRWTTLTTATLPHELRAGRVTSLEFWHVDQALWLFVDGRFIARGEYDWSPEDRLRAALRLGLAEVIRSDAANQDNTLSRTEHYRQAESIRWEFSGGPLALHRVALDRDIHYQPISNMGLTQRPRAAHPLNPMVLGDSQFFVCGDNSAASLDARLWGDPDPWVAATIDATPGVVPRDLMIGRAFFVYFPSLIRGAWSPLPMPDFGRMRFIW